MCASSKFGHVRVKVFRFAADVPSGVADRRGKFAAFLADADTPALLRKGALKSLGRKSDSSHNC